jgi:putative ABC transport system substrate-binding protein
MTRANFIVRVLSLALLALAATGAWAAGPEGGKYRVYMVLWRGVTDAEKGFMAYFRENRIPVEFIIRDANNDKARLTEFVQEIKRERPDLVYTFGTTVTAVVAGTQQDRDPAVHVTDIPVVFNIVADPVAAGLSDTMGGTTGRNLTGASHAVPVETQVKAIRTLGNFTRVGAIYNPLEANSVVAIEQMEASLKALGIKLVKAPVPVENDKPVLAAVPDVVRSLAERKVEIVYLPSDSFLISNSEAVVAAINARGLPTFSATESPIRKAGALIGVVSNYFTVGKFAGFKAKQILVDQKPAAKIPIETLAKYTFLVNLDTMRSLQYYPPVTVLQFAEVVSRE